MSLVFGAISPHPPVVIPEIGGENLKQVKQTAQALKDLEEDLYASKPDTIIIISPHGIISPDNFLLNIAPHFSSNLEEFGDFKNKLEFSADIQLASKIEEAAEDNSIPISLIDKPQLDHGVSVPLFFLTQHLPKVKIVPISYCLLDWKTHLNFGQTIAHEIAQTNKRVAVIASGDLSHSLKEGAPAGYSAEGKKFDQTLVKLLANNDIESITHLDSGLVEAANECGLRSILILLGIFQNSNWQTRVISYEGPLGVGYLVASLTLK